MESNDEVRSSATVAEPEAASGVESPLPFPGAVDGKIKLILSKPDGEETTILFRVPDLEDLAEVDQEFPALPVDQLLEDELESNDEDSAAKAMEKIVKDPAAMIRLMKRANKLICLCAIDPEVWLSPNPNDGHSVRSFLSGDRMTAFMVLLNKAGFNKQASVRIAPFVERSISSSPATE